ncbi:MAG: sodium-translocating pyrophosphatase [Candidatus Nealsonbacteria bacterium]|nr:sodium-translocating pyrophosphatase [Candidatus Nealsonbacteria bacterium]
MIYFPIIVSIFTISFAYFLAKEVKRASPGENKMAAISGFIREGALAYLKRQYKVIALVALALFFLLWLTLGFKVASGFLLGAVFSGAAGFSGMMVSTMSNSRVAEASKRGPVSALSLAFKGSSVTGLLVGALGLFSVSLLFWLTKDLQALLGLGFGGSLISIFARLGGGIYTKAADVGADLVGKLEKNIPEDDPRNPAVIADLVGDNVGDCAGMAADVFETYVVTLVSGMFLGGLMFPQYGNILLLPLMLGAVALVASVIIIFLFRFPGLIIPSLGQKEINTLEILYKGLIGTGILSAIGFFPVIKAFLDPLYISSIRIYFAALLGLFLAACIFWVTEYYTSKKFSAVKSIAKASLTGPGTTLIAGLAIGFRSTALPVLLVVFGIFASFWLGGIYGLAMAVLSMLSLSGFVIALDAFGPIADNAGGIAEMAQEPEEVRRVTDSLDEAGNTTKAVTKAYAITSAGLAALILFSAFVQEVEKAGVAVQFFLDNHLVLAGLFIGGLLPFFFSSLAMEGVGKAASSVVEEVRRQFRGIEGLQEGRAKPDYGRCVDIVTKAALKEMMIPAVIPIVSPLLVGFLLGPEALGGVLIGSIVTGLFLAIFMSSGGAAWDNAKKYIEEGNYGGKGSDAHKAAVVGDIVGDPFKDTAGPAINPMIKVINIIALLMVGFFAL